MSLNSQEKTSGEWPTYPDESAAADRAAHDHDHETKTHSEGTSGHSGHRWMMLLMCLPLVAIGVWQFASGGGWAALLGGLACFAMMAVMHLGMGSSHRH
ncbi:MAG TPA: hypothetical protein PLB21_04640 [Actinomycetota bacterium]|nr:hypothetical protein [Actinomycetota bacterium]